MTYQIELSDEDFRALHQITERMDGIYTVEGAIRKMMYESGRADVSLRGDVVPVPDPN